MSGFISAPPKPVFRVLYRAFGHIDGEKTSIWLFDDHILRVYRNDPTTGQAVVTDYTVIKAELGSHAALFGTDDGTTIRFERSSDCCGWGAIGNAGPDPSVHRYLLEFIHDTDWAVRT